MVPGRFGKFQRSVSIIGVGATPFCDINNDPEMKGLTEAEFYGSAALAAMADAGIEPRDVEFFYHGSANPKFFNFAATPNMQVAEWVAKEWNLNRQKFVRPFYPGGDYQKEKYEADAVVVDNPPFSILSEIIRWYCENGIRFFLFAPTLSLFTAVGCDVEYMPVGVQIMYENGATVNTSFVNNIGENRIYVSPELYETVDKANDETIKEKHRDIPKYDYPVEAVLAARVYTLAKYGQTLKVPKTECVYQNRLDEQKKTGKDAFGGLFLISERAAAEQAAAERWTLSERERKIVKSLGMKAER